jgi:hypothetical protein
MDGWVGGLCSVLYWLVWDFEGWVDGWVGQMNE